MIASAQSWPVDTSTPAGIAAAEAHLLSLATADPRSRNFVAEAGMETFDFHNSLIFRCDQHGGPHLSWSAVASHLRQHDPAPTCLFSIAWAQLKRRDEPLAEAS